MRSQRKTTFQLSKRNLKPNNCSHILSSGGLFSEVLSYPWRALKNPHTAPKHTQEAEWRREKERAKGKMCLDAWFYRPGFNVCLRFLQKASHSVGLLTGSFLPQLQWPSDQPSFASQFMNFKAVRPEVSRWWTAGTLKREIARRAKALLLAV